MINAILNRKALARTSSAPGKTISINFYDIDQKLYLCDVPGYGYANISKQQLLKFGTMMEEYFERRKQKKGVVILVDARHMPTDDDHTMLEYVRYFALPIVIVATKIDKVPKTRLAHQLALIRKDLQLRDNEKMFAFSSVSGQGADEVWKCLIPMFER